MFMSTVCMLDKDGTLIETDKELKPGQVVIIHHVSDYAIRVDEVWEDNGQKIFSYRPAEQLIVRVRVPGPLSAI